jgi:hypothetical protein
MHMLYHRQPPKVIQALAGHKDARSIEVYTRVFALDAGGAVQRGGRGSSRGAAIASAGLKAAGKEAVHPAP